MSISITRYVDINSGVGGANIVPQRALVARIFTNNSLLPPQTFVSFSDASDVGAYFGTASEEYLRALFYFSFISKTITVPQTIQYARWTVNAVAPMVQSISTNSLLPISMWTSIGSGSFGITIGSLIGVFTGITFSNTQSGTLTSTSITVTGLSNTSGLVVGMSVMGTGISSGTTIASIISSTSITLSAAATVSGAQSLIFTVLNYSQIAAIIQATIQTSFSLQQTGSLTAASNAVSGLSNTAVLSVGMTVNGIGIPANTTIATITDSTDITLSNTAVGIIQTGTLTSTADTVSGLTDTSVLSVGMKVTGTGIPTDTTIASIVDMTDITLSADATVSGAETLTFIAATTSLTFYTVANSAFANATVTFNSNNQFVFIGGAVGSGSSLLPISIQAGTSGTDITALTYLGWLPPVVYDSFGNFTTGAITSPGSAAETITQTLTNSANISNNFGSFLFLNNLNLSLANAILAASWNITQNNTYMFCAPVTNSNYSDWSADIGGLGTYAGTALTLSGLSFTLTGVLATSSNIITGLFSTAGLSPGMPISGTGIPSGTVIQAIAAAPSTNVTMSNASTASGPTIITFILSQFPEQIPMMILAATDYTLSNSVQNYMFQGPFAGLFPTVTSDTQANTYDAAAINYYGSTQEAGQIINFYQTGILQGTNVSPLDMTSYTNEMWLKDAIIAQIMNLFIGLSQIPANIQGRSILLTGIQTPINVALNNGTISVNKILTTSQKEFIFSITNDPDAWYQVQSTGYWLDCMIIPPVSPAIAYSAAFTLVYSKDDVIRLVTGRDILI